MSIIRENIICASLERAVHFKHCVILLNIYHQIGLLRDAETAFVLNPDFKLLEIFFLIYIHNQETHAYTYSVRD